MNEKQEPEIVRIRRKVYEMERHAIDGLVSDILEAMFPTGDMEHEWSPDTLDMIRMAFNTYNILNEE